MFLLGARQSRENFEYNTSLHQNALSHTHYWRVAQEPIYFLVFYSLFFFGVHPKLLFLLISGKGCFLITF